MLRLRLLWVICDVSKPLEAKKKPKRKINKTEKERQTKPRRNRDTNPAVEPWRLSHARRRRRWVQFKLNFPFRFPRYAIPCHPSPEHYLRLRVCQGLRWLLYGHVEIDRKLAVRRQRRQSFPMKNNNITAPWPHFLYGRTPRVNSPTRDSSALMRNRKRGACCKSAQIGPRESYVNFPEKLIKTDSTLRKKKKKRGPAPGKTPQVTKAKMIPPPLAFHLDEIRSSWGVILGSEMFVRYFLLA